jgi:hypothetical protein
MSKKCSCNVEAGEVCSVCEAMSARNTAELSDYLNNFVNKRFPNGLEGDIRQIISECILDAFHDGARWADVQRERDDNPALNDVRRIILQP